MDKFSYVILEYCDKNSTIASAIVKVKTTDNELLSSLAQKAFNQLKLKEPSAKLLDWTYLGYDVVFVDC